MPFVDSEDQVEMRCILSYWRAFSRMIVPIQNQCEGHEINVEKPESNEVRKFKTTKTDDMLLKKVLGWSRKLTKQISDIWTPAENLQ